MVISSSLATSNLTHRARIQPGPCVFCQNAYEAGNRHSRIARAIEHAHERMHVHARTRQYLSPDAARRNPPWSRGMLSVMDRIRETVLAGYQAAADDLAVRYEQPSFERVHAHTAHLYPSSPSRALDVGAGTGRDAAHLAALGHDVVAVEPVDAMRQRGQALHGAEGIQWVEDSLPLLARLNDIGPRFDLITCIAVWQHLTPGERASAFEVLASKLAQGGLLVLSLRRGPAPAERPVLPIDVADTVYQAEHHGLRCVLQKDAQSLQARNRNAGVHWTWLALRAGS